MTTVLLRTVTGVVHEIDLNTPVHVSNVYTSMVMLLRWQSWMNWFLQQWLVSHRACKVATAGCLFCLTL